MLRSYYTSLQTCCPAFLCRIIKSLKTVSVHLGNVTVELANRQGGDLFLSQTEEAIMSCWAHHLPFKTENEQLPNSAHDRVLFLSVLTGPEAKHPPFREGGDHSKATKWKSKQQRTDHCSQTVLSTAKNRQKAFPFSTAMGCQRRQDGLLRPAGKDIPLPAKSLPHRPAE